ncbi:hypothetical protein VN97_g11695 [Penicillium thymicola]|uniref:Uncharacterized protein n=1 Tax=Penicillium thymicola TaxID=293382 RepID=A0AAI9X2S9_PENTH|nr:hypothetical protein VN97_g11695 [Penicillium thymicola]
METFRVIFLISTIRKTSPDFSWYALQSLQKRPPGPVYTDVDPPSRMVNGDTQPGSTQKAPRGLAFCGISFKSLAYLSLLLFAFCPFLFLFCFSTLALEERTHHNRAIRAA